jgi:hypothetical protein
MRRPKILAFLFAAALQTAGATEVVLNDYFGDGYYGHVPEPWGLTDLTADLPADLLSLPARTSKCFLPFLPGPCGQWEFESSAKTPFAEQFGGELSIDSSAPILMLGLSTLFSIDQAVDCYLCISTITLDMAFHDGETGELLSFQTLQGEIYADMGYPVTVAPGLALYPGSPVDSIDISYQLTLGYGCAESCPPEGPPAESPFVYGFHGLTLMVVTPPVPEPASAWLALLGVAMLAWRARPARAAPLQRSDRQRVHVHRPAQHGLVLRAQRVQRR